MLTDTAKCPQHAYTHTHTLTHVQFSDLLLQMRPWEYLCHHSTQIKAVNRDPGGREESKNISLLFPSTPWPVCVCVCADEVGASAYIHLLSCACVCIWEMCEKMDETHQWWLCGSWAACPIHLLFLWLAIIPWEKKNIYTPRGCMVARGLFTC